jgi:hypothetical protein
MTKEIKLTTRDMVALVDDDMYDYLMQWKWTVHNGRNTLYAVRKGKRPLQKKVWMHREITNAPAGMQVDHINGDGLCNLRENLRVCTVAENLRNRRKPVNNTSGYKGARLHKETNRYQACIEINGKAIHLGYYTDPVDAARAYDEAARKYFGEFAKLNFS